MTLNGVVLQKSKCNCGSLAREKKGFLYIKIQQIVFIYVCTCLDRASIYFRLFEKKRNFTHSCFCDYLD